jgi:hypothetical protein
LAQTKTLSLLAFACRTRGSTPWTFSLSHTAKAGFIFSAPPQEGHFNTRAHTQRSRQAHTTLSIRSNPSSCTFHSCSGATWFVALSVEDLLPETTTYFAKAAARISHSKKKASSFFSSSQFTLGNECSSSAPQAPGGAHRG